MKITWKLTQELTPEGSPIPMPDFTALDSERVIGRVYQVEEGPARGTWAWEMTAVDPGQETGDAIVSGRAAERAEAGRRVLRAYQALLRRRAAG